MFFGVFMQEFNNNLAEVVALDFSQESNKCKFLVIHQESGLIQFFNSELSDELGSQLLGRKEIALFNLLFKNKGVPLSRDQIMDDVWNGSVVGDNTLSVTVSKLRRVLRRVNRSDDIVTLGRFGYMLNLSKGKSKIIERGRVKLIA